MNSKTMSNPASNETTNDTSGFAKTHIAYILGDGKRYLVELRGRQFNEFSTLQEAIRRRNELKTHQERRFNNLSIYKFVYQELDGLYPYRDFGMNDLVYFHHNHYGYLEEYYSSTGLITSNRFIDRYEMEYSAAVELKKVLGTGWNIYEAYAHKPRKVKLKYVRKEKSKTIKIERKVYSEIGVW
jgi:hypothetical protein